jgi:DNA-binding NtrC family response regulator
MTNEELLRPLELDATPAPSLSSPLHVVVATEHDDLTWSVFNALGSLPDVRVTACRSAAQARYVCALDPPQIVIVDLRILEHDPLALVFLANTAREHTHIVALSDHPVFEVGARFGQVRLTFLQKPVAPEDLALLLRLRLDEEEPSLAPNVC